VKDKRVLTLVKAFLKAGIMTELGERNETTSGTPQGGLCSAEHNPPYEQCWVMRSVGWSGLVGAVPGIERCA
jgi:RNA-directed DNA polymerase